MVSRLDDLGFKSTTGRKSLTVGWRRQQTRHLLFFVNYTYPDELATTSWGT